MSCDGHATLGSVSDTNGIVAKDEIIRILKQAEASNPEVSADMIQADLELVRVEGTRLVIGLKKIADVAAPLSAAISKNMLYEGAAIEVIFSQVDGQYAIRDKVGDLTSQTFTVDAAHSLIRLQRRQDFRVSVKHEAMKFIWSAKREHVVVPIPLELIDLSAGGLRLLWPPQAGPIPRKDEKLSGRLLLRGGTDELAIDVTVLFVKDHGPDAPMKPEVGDALSFKFEPLSQDDARTLLFSCVGIARSIYGSR